MCAKRLVHFQDWSGCTRRTGKGIPPKGASAVLCKSDRNFGPPFLRPPYKCCPQFELQTIPSATTSPSYTRCRSVPGPNGLAIDLLKLNHKTRASAATEVGKVAERILSLFVYGSMVRSRELPLRCGSICCHSSAVFIASTTRRLN